MGMKVRSKGPWRAPISGDVNAYFSSVFRNMIGGKGGQADL